jgi:hypothetical protein
MLVGFTLLAMVGCQCNPRKFNVTVERSEQLQHDAIDVDVVAVAPTRQSIWQNKSVTEYFQPGDRLRQRQDIVTLAFRPGGQRQKQLKRTDKIWDSWLREGKTTLFLLADLPGGGFEKGGPGNDLRRLALPLDECRWEKGIETIPIRLSPSGVNARRNPKPPQGE